MRLHPPIFDPVPNVKRGPLFQLHNELCLQNPVFNVGSWVRTDAVGRSIPPRQDIGHLALYKTLRKLKFKSRLEHLVIHQ